MLPRSQMSFLRRSAVRMELWACCTRKIDALRIRVSPPNHGALSAVLVFFAPFTDEMQRGLGSERARKILILKYHSAVNGEGDL